MSAGGGGKWQITATFPGRSGLRKRTSGVLNESGWVCLWLLCCVRALLATVVLQIFSEQEGMVSVFGKSEPLQTKLHFMIKFTKCKRCHLQP